MDPQFLFRFIELNNPLRFTISILSVKHLDPEVIDLFIRAGINDFTLAIESGSPEMQKIVGKNLDLDKAVQVTKEIQSRGVNIHVCWMVGFPHETLSQIHVTFDLARRVNAESDQFLTVVPYPGTEMFERAKNDDLLVFGDDYLDRYDIRRCDYLKSDEWNYQQLQEMIYNKVIELNFLKTPFLRTENGKKAMISRMKGLILSLPNHIIAHIVLGYLLKQELQTDESRQHYATANRLLKIKNLSAVFSKYLTMDNPIIRDFTASCREK